MADLELPLLSSEEIYGGKADADGPAFSELSTKPAQLHSAPRGAPALTVQNARTTRSHAGNIPS